ncbi:MAG TPA: hypothetical protein VFF04_03465 [Candidatus Babeliales bacterium]|nr:hypothetical protein [Candidatus Babeliales bacterium]
MLKKKNQLLEHIIEGTIALGGFAILRLSPTPLFGVVFGISWIAFASYSFNVFYGARRRPPLRFPDYINKPLAPRCIALYLLFITCFIGLVWGIIRLALLIQTKLC